MKRARRKRCSKSPLGEPARTTAGTVPRQHFQRSGLAHLCCWNKPYAPSNSCKRALQWLSSKGPLAGAHPRPSSEV